MPDARPGGLPDLLRFPGGALEDDTDDQRHRAAPWRGEETQPQDGRCLSQRMQLSANVLRGDPRPEVQENLDAGHATRLRASTRNLTAAEVDLPPDQRACRGPFAESAHPRIAAIALTGLLPHLRNTEVALYIIRRHVIIRQTRT